MPSNIASASQLSRSPASIPVLLSKGVTRLESHAGNSPRDPRAGSRRLYYLGGRELLNGSPNTVFFAAVIYSVAVSVGNLCVWVF